MDEFRVSRLAFNSNTRLETHNRVAHCRLLKKAQRQGARRSMSGGVPLYVDAKSIERNEAYGVFFSSLLRRDLIEDNIDVLRTDLGGVFRVLAEQIARFTGHSVAVLV
jgi:hypothetical protein